MFTMLNKWEIFVKSDFYIYYGEMMAIIFEFNWRQYVSATTYIKLDQENKKLNENIKWYEKEEDRLRWDNKKLKNSIEYRKKKAESNQEKANQIDKIMNLPWVMVDWKIDWSKVAVYYMM